jgi:hypothetical protein
MEQQLQTTEFSYDDDSVLSVEMKCWICGIMAVCSVLFGAVFIGVMSIDTAKQRWEKVGMMEQLNM